jgi:hypothetical protein
MTLCTNISTLWIDTFGQPKHLVQDGETGMRGRSVADWADANRLQLVFKPPGSKAWIAESHQSILRKTAHTTELQLQKEGIYAPIGQTIAARAPLGPGATLQRCGSGADCAAIAGGTRGQGQPRGGEATCQETAT